MQMKTSVAEKTEYSSQRGALKLKPAARYLSVAPITLRRLIARGLVKPNRATRHLLFPVAELDRFLQQ
jgi:hypothetical protein